MGTALAGILAAGCLLENTSVVLAGRRMNKEVRAAEQPGSRFLSVPVLSLVQPICVKESHSGAERQGVRELRLAAHSKRIFEDIKALRNARVDVTGIISLVRESSGPDVILTVRAIKRRAAGD
ncbi:MAG: hypothetical protein HY926_10380 [Elusimicrobia bacterium]|nr:hypothetical protein [Elusimicrobiota bacterium]